MDFSLGNYWYLFLLLVLPVVGLLFIHFIRWKSARKNSFAEKKFQNQLFEKNKIFSKIFPILYFLAFLFLLFSIIDLLSGKQEMKVKQKMNNVIFLLDVSNSMNAQDVEPSRLEVAKNIIVQTMQKLMNDKIGIVVFAGESQSVMPLTTDYSAAQTYVNAIETNVVAKQGTDFLKAMETASGKFKNILKGSKKVILISDGEDNEGNENAAISEANKDGISVVSVGIGKDEGAPIPEYYYGQLLDYKTDTNGETVMSKRETQALVNIANSTNGEYIDGNNPEIAVNKIISFLKNKSGETESVVKSQSAIHYYQYFLAVSLFLFFLIYLLNPKRDLNI